jgi:hypothetical protein
MVLGFLAAVVGGWTLHHLHVETATCVPHSARTPGFGVSSNCLDQVGQEYVAFGVLMLGLFVFAFALLLMRRHRNSKKAPIHGERDLIGTPGGIPLVRRQADSYHPTGREGRKRGSAPPRGLPDRSDAAAPSHDLPVYPPRRDDRS